MINQTLNLHVAKHPRYKSIMCINFFHKKQQDVNMEINIYLHKTKKKFILINTIMFTIKGKETKLK